MLNKKIEEAINNQINAEMWSAYLYLSMSMNAEAAGYKGVANWFYIQFQEEQAHARIFMNYLNSRGAAVKLAAIDAVPTSWATNKAAFEDTLEHEKKVTALINNIDYLAHEERDFATLNMIGWFIDEQVEEEESVNDIINTLEMLGDSKNGFYTFDKELASRVYVAPTQLTK